MYNLLKKFQHTAQDVRKVGVGLLLAGLTVTSCSEMDKYFETPSWLRGSIQETLTEDGNYSQFLAAAERVGFKPILEGASICTVSSAFTSSTTLSTQTCLPTSAQRREMVQT